MTSILHALMARGPTATLLCLLAAFAAAQAIAATLFPAPSSLPPPSFVEVCAPTAMGDAPCSR